MNFYRLTWSNFTRNNNFKKKCEIDGQIYLCSYCIGCDFKNLETIDEEEISAFLKL